MALQFLASCSGDRSHEQGDRARLKVFMEAWRYLLIRQSNISCILIFATGVNLFVTHLPETSSGPGSSSCIHFSNLMSA